MKPIRRKRRLRGPEESPAKVSEVICVCCWARWVDERPAGTRLKDMECPNCRRVGGVIETGEVGLG